MSWNLIPAELRERPQWAICGGDKAPCTVVNGKVTYASVNEPNTWMRFEDACQAAYSRGLNIGFILSENDPYTCIDLDVKDAENCPDHPELWTTQEDYDLYYRMMKTYASYTESSVSGKGLHIWVRADVGAGRKRGNVEIYSRQRFIVTTGRVVENLPIADRNEMACNMASQMDVIRGSTIELEEVEAVDDDWYILQMAAEADNKDKFLALYEGRWHELGYPSQSEADVALMSMFTFYSPSNEQCRRLFRMSALGQREKAVKNDVYLNRTLKMIRSREAEEQAVDLSCLAASIDATAAIRQKAAKAIANIQGAPMPSRVEPALHVVGQNAPVAAPTPAPVVASLAAPVSAEVVSSGKVGLSWCPGFAGRIAQYIYQTAPRPVKEVAIVSALGLLAGICGKAWHIPQSGLNMYIVLIARSAVGKEAMHSGISSLIAAASQKMPTFHSFVDFTDYASGPALMKAVAANPSFVNVSGEWGRKLKRLSDDLKDGPLTTLRTQMTNLYQKSGPQSVVGGIGYSNKDNNIASVSGVAYSMIGETTPDTFYQSLTPSMMEDGFLSRFLIIEYDGQRPPMNNKTLTSPDEALTDGLVKLAFQAQNLLNMRTSQPVDKTAEAAEMLSKFELECDNEINKTDDESYRQMWNRAALKAARLSALLAVADNWITPIITKEHLDWAITVVRRDIGTMSQKLMDGDIGLSDDSRERKMLSIMVEYLRELLPVSYGIKPQMQVDGVIPRSYLSRRLSRITSYAKYPRGSNAALDATLASLIANGFIMECKPVDIVKNYSFYGKCYRILNIDIISEL